jgi:aminomethyltransferase
MKDFQARYGLLCNDQGGVRDDVLVYRWPYGWAMVVNAANRAKIVGWLEQQKGGRDAALRDQTESTCMLALQGPKAVGLCAGLTAADPAALAYYHSTATTYRGGPCIVSRTGYTGEDGVELMVGAEQGVALWEEVVKRGAKPCGLGARDTLRLEAAMPLYDHELTEETDPLQAGLGWAVKLDKGDFVGRDALRRKVAPRRTRVGLELHGRRIAREGAVVQSVGAAVGQVTSGTFAPTLQKAIAMAYVEPAHAVPGAALTVDVRGQAEMAAVVPLPFYRRKKP